MFLNQSIVEDADLEWFGGLVYAVGHGSHLAPSGPAAGRVLIYELVLLERLHETIRRLNPAIPQFRTIAARRGTLLPKWLSGELSATANLLASTESWRQKAITTNPSSLLNAVTIYWFALTILGVIGIIN